MKKLFKITLLVFVFGGILLGQVFSETAGENAFKSNQPGTAAPLLEQEIKSGNITPDTYNFLGLSYYQLGQYTKAIDAFERGIKEPSSNRKVLSFNQGNAAYKSGDFSKAESCFSLAISVSPSYYEAVLNRANTRLMMKKYPDAVEDYVAYITALPEDPQVENIKKLIGYLQEQIAFDESEKARLMEEQQKRDEENRLFQEELARQMAEKARLEQELRAQKELREAEQRALEEERRRKILEDVANSLQQTETTNMTAGAEETMDYDYESELD